MMSLSPAFIKELVYGNRSVEAPKNIEKIMSNANHLGVGVTESDALSKDIRMYLNALTTGTIQNVKSIIYNIFSEGRINSNEILESFVREFIEGCITQNDVTLYMELFNEIHSYAIMFDENNVSDSCGEIFLRMCENDISYFQKQKFIDEYISLKKSDNEDECTKNRYRLMFLLKIMNFLYDKKSSGMCISWNKKNRFQTFKVDDQPINAIIHHFIELLAIHNEKKLNTESALDEYEDFESQEYLDLSEIDEINAISYEFYADIVTSCINIFGKTLLKNNNIDMIKLLKTTTDKYYRKAYDNKSIFKNHIKAIDNAFSE